MLVRSSSTVHLSSHHSQLVQCSLHVEHTIHLNTGPNESMNDVLIRNSRYSNYNKEVGMKNAKSDLGYIPYAVDPPFGLI